MKSMRGHTDEYASRARNAKVRLRGAALLEFALVSFAFYLLFAGTVAIGRWIYTQQAAQDVARFAAREMALYPLPPAITFADALDQPEFRLAVYDETQLVIDLDAIPLGTTLDEFVAQLPPVNRALVPLMLTSRVDVNGEIRNLLHMPGVITDSPDPASPTGLTVMIPRVAYDETGTEIVDPVLQEVLDEVVPNSFSLDPTIVNADGLVHLRLNVPFQSAALSAYVPRAPEPGDEPINQVVLANDPVAGANILGSGPNGTGAYSGTQGLGSQFALGRRVRPFRRLVSPQALFRREVFR